MEAQKYPVSTADFERIRTENYLYVDKTEYIHSLVTRGVFYFLSRPRRFGKSLLQSTLAAYFSGQRELFKGLAIDRLQPEPWETYPVLRLDLSGKAYTDKASLTSLLDMQLQGWELKYGIKDTRKTVDERFTVLLHRITELTGKKVVILIDEYDSPLSETIGNKELQESYREQLHGFYSVLKREERNIQFCMLTGVTKFGKVSVFSGLNNLNDITFDNQYAGICGITEKELRTYFTPGIERLAEAENCSMEEAFNQLKFYYDGYHFTKSLLDIYNPFSVLKALDRCEIEDYWCITGMPTLLSKSLRDIDFNIEELKEIGVTQSMLGDVSVYKTDPIPLFYQTGYLTIKDYDQEAKIYTLRYPNREVERGILNNILRLYIPSMTTTEGSIVLMRRDLCNGKPEQFVARLKAYLAGIPSKLRTHVSQYENYYHTIFYCIMSLIGLNVKVEYNTSSGFIDVVIETKDYIYIIELKVNGSAAVAMRQIEKKQYAAPFAMDPRKLFKVALGFSKKTASITSSIIF